MLTKIKDIWAKYKRELIVGIVVSLVTALVMQAGNWLITTAPAMGNSLLDTVQNLVCTSAATISNLHIFSIIISLVVGTIISLCLIPIVKLIIFYYREEKNTKKLKKLLESSSSADMAFKEQVMNELSQLSIDSLVKKNPTDRKKQKNMGLILGFSFCFFVLLIIYIELFLVLPLNMVDSFQRDILAITPYSDTHTIQQLESDWVCMRSENEYDKIYEVIDEIKQTHNLP